MTHASNPEPYREDIVQTINTAVQAAYAEMINHFDQRHDALTDRLRHLEREVATLRRQGGDAHRQNNLADVLAQQAQAMMGQPSDAPLPRPDTPVPVAVEEACATDPADGAQRVDLTEYGTVAILRPGSDPETAWQDLQNALNEEMNTRGVRRPRRARQR